MKESPIPVEWESNCIHVTFASGDLGAIWLDKEKMIEFELSGWPKNKIFVVESSSIQSYIQVERDT